MRNLFSKILSKKTLASASAGFVIFTTTTEAVLFEDTKKTVEVTVNGQEKVVKTHADTIRDLLNEMNVHLRSQDRLSPAADTKVRTHLKVVLRQARQVHFSRGKENKTIWTTAPTVAELLKEQKIELNDHDQITPKLNTFIKEKMNINISKAVQFTYVDGGREQKVWSTSATVADFLIQQGIRLNELDRVEPSLSEPLTDNGVVNVIRVEKVTDVVEEPLQFAVITKNDASLDKGIQKTLNPGRQGKISKQYEVVLENGKEIARKLIDEQLVQEKQDQLVAVGTKDSAVQVSSGSGTEFYVNSTAYTTDCNVCSGRTATGINLLANPNVKVIAVDPRIIPLGTRVYIDGYGYAVAADTGGAIYGYKIDVFFPSRTEAYRWGVRRVKIKVLN